MNEKQKILIISNVFGNFNNLIDLYNKITIKNGEFNILILIGNVFSLSENFSNLELLKSLKCNKIIIFDNSNVSEIIKSKFNYSTFNYTEKIIFLTRSGIFNIFNINIAYLNGKENINFLQENFIFTSNFFNKEDIKNLINQKTENNKKIDLLLLSNLPSIFFKEIQNDFSSAFNNTNIKIDKNQINQSKISDFLINFLNPRYILTSVDDFYFERIPFVNNEKIFTRFLNLGYFQNKINKTQNFLYAIQIKPFSLLNEDEIFNLNDVKNNKHTENPFLNNNLNENLDEFINKIEKEENNIKIFHDTLFLCNLEHSLTYDELNDFLSSFGKVNKIEMIYKKKFFTGTAFVQFNDLKIHKNLLEKNNYYNLKGRKIGIREKTIKINNEKEIAKNCWFCFDNPNIEKNLILKEFANFYFAYNKGPITNFHFLIIPKKHIQNSFKLKGEIKQELNELISSLIEFIKINNLETLIYEKSLPYNNINYKHMIINVIGIEKNFMDFFIDFGNTFFKENKINYEISMENNFLENKINDEYFFYIEGNNNIKIGKEKKRCVFYIKINENNKDFTDYCRIFVCNLIEKYERKNWKNCDINDEFLILVKKKFNEFYIN